MLARLPSLVVSANEQNFLFKPEVRKRTKEWLSISKFKPDLDFLASRVKEFNAAVYGMFTLILYKRPKDPVWDIMQKDLQQNFLFSKGKLDTDIS